ncbi:MAG: helix-turn-helix transcriptional regulator [Oscillospiraceae bacterium]|nr:helix-turn-helix transcriptional regulator [Oscillospiraceae bacterium]
MAITMKAARLNAGYTQAHAAKKLGVNTGTLCNWETGKTSPSIVQWLALCKLYGMDIGDILIPSESSLTELDGDV